MKGAWSMTEAALLAEVRDELDGRGLWHLHISQAKRTSRGWPDLVIMGGGRMLYRELKTTEGRLSAAQWTVRGMIEAAGGDYAVWRPRELLTGQIERELDRLAPAPLVTTRG